MNGARYMKPNKYRNRKPVSPAREYERRIAALPPMSAEEYSETCEKIARELGVDPDQRKNYAGY